MDTDDAVRPRTQASPGALASRRQKNLQKFRKHKEAQRQTLQAVVPSDVNSPRKTSKETPSNPLTKAAAVESAEVVAVEENKPKEVTTSALSKKKRFAKKKKAAARVEQAPKPATAEPVVSVSARAEVVSGPVNNSNKKMVNNSAPSNTPTVVPVPPVATKEQKEGPVQAKDPPKSPAFHSNKRRSDIIRKLAKKNRGTSHTDNTSNKESMLIQPIFGNILDCEEDEKVVSSSQQSSEGTAATDCLLKSPLIQQEEENSKVEVSDKPLEQFRTQENEVKEELVQSMEKLAINTQPPLFEKMEGAGVLEEIEAVETCCDPEPASGPGETLSIEEEKTEMVASLCSSLDKEVSPTNIESSVMEDTEKEASIEVASTNAESIAEETEMEAEVGMRITEDPTGTPLFVAVSDFPVEKMEMAAAQCVQQVSPQPDSIEDPTGGDGSAMTDEVPQSDINAIASDEGHLCETSASFDLRSIHDFPPEPVKMADEALPSQDPSWDTAKVIFNEFVQPISSESNKSKGDSVNMFDTAEASSWTEAESVTFSQDFHGGLGDNDFAGFATESTSAQNFFGHEVLEEKKDTDSVQTKSATDSIAKEPVVVAESGSEDSNLSPRRLLSRHQVNNNTTSAGSFDVSNLAMDSTDELDTTVKAVEEADEITATVGDDEGLLQEKVDDDSGCEQWKNESPLSREERVQQYTSSIGDNGSENSSIGSSVQEDETDDESSEAMPDVGYISHSEEEDDDEVTEGAADGMPAEIIEDTPAFVIPTEETKDIPVKEKTAEESPRESVAQLTSENLAQDSAADTGESPPPSSAMDVIDGSTTKAVAVDSMQSVSPSSSGDSAVLTDDMGKAERTETVDTTPIGYISNSSSSDSSASDSLETTEEETLKTEIKKVEIRSNGEDDVSIATKPFEKSKSSDISSEQASNETEDVSKGAVVAGEKAVPELEEATSLVGVSLVPSWGANASRKIVSSSSGQSKAAGGLGIPPRSSGSPSTVLPPPPPPPLSKKKKKKKKRKGGSSAVVPLLAPPPAEKFKKWEESKNRASVHFSEQLNSKTDKHTIGNKAGATRRPPGVTPINCEADVAEVETWEEPPESPGTVHIACGALPGQGAWASFPKEKERASALLGQGQLACGSALAMAGLVGSPKRTDQGNVSKESSVDTARSIALQNAMLRAKNEGLAHLYGKTCSNEAAKSMRDNAMMKASSTSSSSCASKTKRKAPPGSDGECVEDPPTLMRKQMSGAEDYQSFPDSPQAFLQKLTSPSLSMTTPTNNKDNPTLSPSSPLIHDSKMAEKAALASYAAAVTFEEQYAAAREYNETVDSPLDDNHSVDGTKVDKARETATIPSMFCAPEISENFGHMAAGEDGTFFGAKLEQEISGIIEGNSEIFKDLVTGGTPSRESCKTDDSARAITDLKGGAFSPWKNPVYAKGGEINKIETVTIAVLTLSSSCSSDATERSVTLKISDQETCTAPGELSRLARWLTHEVLEIPGENVQCSSNKAIRQHLMKLLEVNENLNKLCVYVTDKINAKIALDNKERAERNSQLSPRRKMKPFQIGTLSGQKSASVVAANFVSFLHRVARASDTPSPFGEDNPFLLDLISTSIYEGNKEGSLSTKTCGDDTTMQLVVFRVCPADVIVKFVAQVCGFNTVGDSREVVEQNPSGMSSLDPIEATRAANPSPTKKSRGHFFGAAVKQEASSPFENAAKEDPRFLSTILSFLGDPACVSRMKLVNTVCRQYVSQNEHVLMRDAVRLGRLSMNLRPAFWLWVTLEKSGEDSARKLKSDAENELSKLEEAGRTGKWHHVIQRDVARSFGNMPPHKTGARLRTDSIVRALVTWGTNRIMKRGVKGDGNPPPSHSQSSQDDTSSVSEASHAPTDTVSDWGGVSPVASFNDGDERNSSQNEDGRSRASRRASRDSSSVATDLLVLSGNALTEEMKMDLQNKLGFILHTLAATHETVGYCQGMDYVVAHLLRILQDTIRWRAAQGTLPASILSAPSQMEVQNGNVLSPNFEVVDKTLVVEETVFKVMDSLFTTYNLRHMYWPELRCLKTCCRVFERLIQLKLPVLADHFEHHELNVGLFALGWFQTLFLYLPSMPSATVCHMWDIWLVERSFKIFFRVGTAILFLSQPILLNHELEGMMTYLNTFPDATLLNPDILIACALQIKVTNKMLMEIEQEVCGSQ